jgi:hypothetical protein
MVIIDRLDININEEAVIIDSHRVPKSATTGFGAFRVPLIKI